MAQGKSLKFDKNEKLADCLAKAKTHWLEKHTRKLEDGSREFVGNNRYTPFQARRGDELVLFVWGGGTLTMFRATESISCGPRQVWDE